MPLFYVPSVAAVLVGCLLPLVYVAYTDCRYYLIYDRATYAIALAGLVAAIYEGRLVDAVAGAVLGFGVVFVFCLLKGAGGGDLKLATALGTWFGPYQMPFIFLAASLIGIPWGLYKKVRSGEKVGEWAKTFFRGIYLRAFYGTPGAIPLPELPEDDDAPVPSEAIPFGACLAAAAWLDWFLQIFHFWHI
ncbi:MAG: A24 family peptidase [Moorellaceae bacterium]